MLRPISAAQRRLLWLVPGACDNCVEHAAGVILQALRQPLGAAVVMVPKKKQRIWHTAAPSRPPWEALRQVLERIRAAGLKLHPEKCRFMQREVTFLGHRVGVRASAP
ncbi:hypothetical protein AAFF_G00032840 [Aldrovandia affinis]|uniref:Reverse transcriptase n=1 Tax=Aldrovandia affinis TaxID=143900 RepID=A0AAD7R241_9TELE|nr:hypothetical protein AAFF_G00032840 [Aldrovandia affinis]